MKRSRVTETELTIQHIEMLLDVLILDGKVEQVCLCWVAHIVQLLIVIE